MAFEINNIAVKKCNVKSDVCKHLKINGINVWNAEYVYFPSAEVCDINNWTIASGGQFQLTEDYIYVWGNSAGTSKQCNVVVDFSKYKKMFITLETVNNDAKFHINWRVKGTGTRKHAFYVEELAENERIKTHEFDVSNINDVCYMVIDVSHGGGGTITKISFEE